MFAIDNLEKGRDIMPNSACVTNADIWSLTSTIYIVGERHRSIRSNAQVTDGVSQLNKTNHPVSKHLSHPNFLSSCWVSSCRNSLFNGLRSLLATVQDLICSEAVNKSCTDESEMQTFKWSIDWVIWVILFAWKMICQWMFVEQCSYGVIWNVNERGPSTELCETQLVNKAPYE